MEKTSKLSSAFRYFSAAILIASLTPSVFPHAEISVYGAGQQQAASTTSVADGLRVVSVNTPNGLVIVKLPDDIRTGDTISGTMVEQPKGENEAERDKNRDAMRKRVIRLLLKRREAEVAKEKQAEAVVVSIPIAGDQNPTVQTAPRFGDSTAFQMKITTPAQLSIGKELGRPDTVVVPIDEQASASKPAAGMNFDVPKVGQTGHPVEILGPFDGKSANTKVNLTPVKGDAPPNPDDDPELTVIAESPRKAIVDCPVEFVGRNRIDVIEGKLMTSGIFRNVGVSLSAPKTALQKGETVSMTITVTGLEYLREDVAMTLSASGVITMSGGMEQALSITPSQVSKEGSYTTTRSVTGLQAGSWAARATVIVVRE